MIFEFLCENCGDVTQTDFPIGKAPKHIKCSKCFHDKAVKLIGKPNFTLNTQFKDTKGTPIWCPDGGYFDRALERPFKNARQKREYMKKADIHMDGSTSTSRDFKKHPRSGDFKTKSGRKAAMMED